MKTAKKATEKKDSRVGKQRLLSAGLILFLAVSAVPQSVEAEDHSTDRPVSSYAPNQVEKISWFRRHFGKVSWEEAVRSCETPSDICSIVGSQLSYDSENGDKWIGARVTWERRRGDCEDFAICVVEMCRELGIEAWVELYFPPGPKAGHAIAVGRYNGKLWMSSIGGYEQVESMEEIEEIVASMLWCRTEGMWKAVMDYDAIQRRTEETSRS